jgi:hypothetical protein
MVTREENELLCRVTGDAPMGRMLRQHYWLPAVLSVRVRKGEAPVRVKLFGRNFVAFRGADGKVGLAEQSKGIRKNSQGESLPDARRSWADLGLARRRNGTRRARLRMDGFAAGAGLRGGH